VIWKDAAVGNWTPAETAVEHIVVNIDGTDRWMAVYEIPV
jgi:hypothetical protein